MKIELNRPGYLGLARVSFAEASSHSIIQNDTARTTEGQACLSDVMVSPSHITMHFTDEKREDVYTIVTVGLEDLETIVKKAGYTVTKAISRTRRPRRSSVEKAIADAAYHRAVAERKTLRLKAKKEELKKKKINSS